MKKILLLLTTICLLSLSSCNKDEKAINDVTHEALPASAKSEPLFVGNTVTIKGTGFTDKSEIWIRKAIVKAAEEVKATITEVTETFITFEVPEVLGEQDIVLKQGDEEKALGKMFFVREEVYGFVSKSDADGMPVSSHIVKYDAKTNTLAKHSDTDGLYICEGNIISLNNALYFSGAKVISLAEQVGDFGVFKYDLKTNTISALISSRDEEFTYDYIFVIEDQVHAIEVDNVRIPAENPVYPGEETFSHCNIEVFNLSSGAAVSVRKFQTVKVDGVNAEPYGIMYDEKTKKILARASIQKEFTNDQGDTYDRYSPFWLSLSIEDGEIKSSSRDGDGFIFTLGDKVYQGTQVNSGEPDFNLLHTDYYEFNPETLKAGTTKLETETYEEGFEVEVHFLNSLNKVFARGLKREHNETDNSYSSSMSLSLYDIDAAGEKITRTPITAAEVDDTYFFFCVVERTE